MLLTFGIPEALPYHSLVIGLVSTPISDMVDCRLQEKPNLVSSCVKKVGMSDGVKTRQLSDYESLRASAKYCDMHLPSKNLLLTSFPIITKSTLLKEWIILGFLPCPA